MGAARKYCVTITSFLRRGGVTPGRDESFQFDAEGIGDSVDVIEVGDDLGGVVDGAVVQANGTKSLDIPCFHNRGTQRQFFGVGAEAGIHGGQRRSTPIMSDGVNISIGFGVGAEPIDLSPEVMGMGLRSVFTVVSAAHDDGQHFALRP